MNIAVVAANGRSGQAFVQAALASGHSVRAGVHSHNPFSPHRGLTVVHCDARDEQDLAELIQDQDAVVSLIGHVSGSPADVQTTAIKHLASTMQKQHVRRLISLTGTGVRFTGDKITILDRLMNLAVTVIDPRRVSDGRGHADILQKSSLNWTIIRVLKLYDGSARPFMLTPHGPAKPFVSRSEVAQAILEVLEKSTFDRQAPIISKHR